MDFWFLVSVSALLLLRLGSVKSSDDAEASPGNSTYVPAPAPASAPTPCPAAAPTSSTLRLGFLTVEWSAPCRGEVVLRQMESNATRRVCLSARQRVRPLLAGVCAQKRGCKGADLLDTELNGRGLQSLEDLEETWCETWRIRCEVERPPEEPQEPVRYKVATVLLSLALVFLLLACLSKPAVKTLQKRLSNKRKNRWIGPTQSHSVSYNRGQTVNLDGQKRSSYPALDHLVVGNREPPSNRSSYNF